jgi:hypothetical protein
VKGKKRLLSGQPRKMGVRKCRAQPRKDSLKGWAGLEGDLATEQLTRLPCLEKFNGLRSSFLI